MADDDPFGIEPLLAQDVWHGIDDIEDDTFRETLLASLNLLDNFNRGWIAEAMVATLCDGRQVGQGWASHDVEAFGLRIEVKTSGWLQSWKQRSRYDASYQVPMTQGTVSDDDGYPVIDYEKKRRNDVYVLAHHRGARPDRFAEWTFYVFPTERLNEVRGDMKALSLRQAVTLLDADVVDCTGLKSVLESLARELLP